MKKRSSNQSNGKQCKTNVIKGSDFWLNIQAGIIIVAIISLTAVLGYIVGLTVVDVFPSLASSGI